MTLENKLRQSGIEALENLADFVNKTEQEKRRLVRHLEGKLPTDHAYEMGQNYHENGPDEFNCHWTLFATVGEKEAWERGFNDAKNKTE